MTTDQSNLLMVIVLAIAIVAGTIMYSAEYAHMVDLRAQKRIDQIEIQTGEVLLYYETKSEIDRAMALGLELYLKSPSPVVDIHAY